MLLRSVLDAGGAVMAREQPECVVLGVRAGAVARPLPPVRIYLGTEEAQFRANRVFLWSIEQVRDPGRIYEIYWMSELAGFDRRGWTTGFTNYRFAIPHFAGGRGRAIYNDEDQIYLSDPAALFDEDMAGRGFLAISATESSVMLIDCEKMAARWTLESARHESKKRILRRTVAEPGILGELDPGWNARDEEYQPGVSKLLHYTTLHTQPWRPFPERFAYQRSEHEGLWLDMESAAVAAGFDIFSRQQPSREFDAARQPPAPRAGGGMVRVRSAAQISHAGACLRRMVEPADRVLELSSDGATGEGKQLAGLVASVESRSLGAWLGADSPVSGVDVVVCTDGLEALPVPDVAWVVSELFRHADRCVFAAVTCPALAPRRRGKPPPGTVHTPEWWGIHFDNAARRYPDVHYELLCWTAPAKVGLAGGASDTDRAPRAVVRVGGRAGDAVPSVWLLTDDRPGNTTQSRGLAEALGWPCREISLAFGMFSYLPNPLVGATLSGLDAASRSKLAPAWPDLVIAAGRRTAPVARFIKESSRGRTRIVQLGRKGANPAAPFDLAVTPVYAQLFPHPRRLETLAPLTRIRPAALAAAAAHWQSLFAGTASPRIALLVGGRSQRHEFDTELAARIGREVAAFAKSAGGSVFATTSRRTGDDASLALERSLAGAVHVHRWSVDAAPEDNPFLGYLALADAFVVTGESESMIAEACATGKPVFIYPLPDRPAKALFAVADAVIDAIVARAHARPSNNRGTTRPQQGLEYFCARLVERGWVRPDRDLHRFHERLVECGVARFFPGPDASFEVQVQAGAPYSETERVAARVRALMGYGESAGGAG